MMIYCLLASAAARGQSLDYDRLESMFGEPVTMGATGKPERLSDTPATMDVITQDDIKRSGARDLATLLRLLPGIRTYRGYNGTEAFSIGAILLNGREIYMGALGETFLDSIPVELEEIRQIEVVRGPQSGLYGFNSAEGVINIITFDPARDSLDYVRLRGGNDARRDGAASVTLSPTDDVGIRLTAGTDHLHEDGFTEPRGMSLAAMNADRRNFSADASAYLPDGGHATLDVAHSDVSLATTVPSATLLLNGRLQNDAVKADYSADTAWGRLGAMGSYTSLTVPEAATYLNGGINLHDHTVDGRLNDLLKLSPDDSVRADFEIRDETVHSGVSAAPIDNLILAESAMWEHSFSDDFSMVNAVRYFSADVSQSGPRLAGGSFHTEPNAIGENSSLIYKAGPEDTIRGSFARGVAPPSQLSFAQLGLTSATARGQSLAAGPELAVWSSSEERLTYDHHFLDWEADGRISLFREQSEDLMALLPYDILASALPACNPPTPRTVRTCRAMTASTGLSGGARGMELQIERKSAAGLTWGANYTLEVLQPHGTASALSLLPDIAAQQTLQKANAHVGYGWNDWNADLRLLYTGPTPALMLDTLSAAPHVAVERDQPILTLSPRLAWRADDQLQVELAAENLWPYRLNPLEKIGSTYYLTVTFSY